MLRNRNTDYCFTQPRLIFLWIVLDLITGTSKNVFNLKMLLYCLNFTYVFNHKLIITSLILDAALLLINYTCSILDILHYLM
jgi:hypothetical protein